MNRQRQLILVRQIMADGRPHTLAELASRTRCPEQSVSARVRDLRKPEYGAHTVLRTFSGIQGVFHYTLVRGSRGGRKAA